MAKYKRYDYDQMIMLPVSLEDQLAVPRKNPVRIEFIDIFPQACHDSYPL